MRHALAALSLASLLFGTSGASGCVRDAAAVGGASSNASSNASSSAEAQARARAKEEAERREMTWREYYADVREHAFRKNAQVIWINPPEVRKRGRSVPH